MVKYDMSKPNRAKKAKRMAKKQEGKPYWMKVKKETYKDWLVMPFDKALSYLTGKERGRPDIPLYKKDRKHTWKAVF